MNPHIQALFDSDPTITIINVEYTRPAPMPPRRTYFYPGDQVIDLRKPGWGIGTVEENNSTTYPIKVRYTVEEHIIWETYTKEGAFINGLPNSLQHAPGE